MLAPTPVRHTTAFMMLRNTLRDQFQQEFRLTSNFDGPLNFVSGVAYYEEDVEFVVFGGLGFLSLLVLVQTFMI